MGTPPRLSVRIIAALCSLAVAPVLSLVANPAQADVATCSLTYELPADLSVDIPDPATDADFMVFAWQHFLALNAPEVNGQINVYGDNETQWSRWSSTADLFDSVHPGASGSRFYPVACRDIPNYEQYRVLQQVGKVDDSFLEAQTAGLSDDPVIDAKGNFVRYEILYSPAMYEDVKGMMLNKQWDLLRLGADVNLSCGNIDDYSGGDPSNPLMGAIMLKVAWRDASGFSDEEKARFHIEDLLVFNPNYRNSSGKNSCELKPMAMVGMHIGHKTTKQPTWFWATFEHTQNAPDCTEQSPAPPSPGKAAVNTACPTGTLNEDYSFFPANCEDGSCATCNAAPEPNDTTGKCDNPLDDDGDSWCLDLPPNPVAGYSRLCRQVPSHVCSNDVSTTCSLDSDCSGATCEESYPAAPEQNTACWQAINDEGDGNSVWDEYELISSQWVAEEFTTPCLNQADAVVTRPTATQTKPPGPVLTENLREQVVLDDDATVTRPLLGNTSMESYDRSNCLGCHAKSYMGSFCASDPSLQCSDDGDCTSVGGACTTYSFSTDFVYSLKLEVGQQPGLRLPGTRLRYHDAPPWFQSFRSVDWSMRSSAVVLGLAESVDDPRCNGDRHDTPRAFMRFVRDGTRLVDPQIELPCQGWRLKGDPANPRSYEYRDLVGRWGPCRKVTIHAGRGVTAKCFGAGIPENMADADATLNVTLKTGSLRYCAQYDSFRTFRWFGGSVATSRRNPAPDMCSVWGYTYDSR